MNWNDLKHASMERLLAWAESEPWGQAMATCAQDSEWHAEGDVWTHTQMVCRELTALDEWSTLSPPERTLLVFTALFHDAAKPATTRTDPDTGRITSPRHAIRGERLARSVLRNLECDVITREQIARMVRYHGRPAFLLDRTDPVSEIVRLSWLVQHRLLYLFAVADTRGRCTASMSRPEENLQYWKLQAEDLRCYCEPYAFASDHARVLYFQRPQPDLHYVPHDDSRCQVTMLAGLPGCGKDTWLTKHRPDLPTVSLDDIRAELGVAPADAQGQVVQTARERCREFLRDGCSFAFNATNLIRDTRKRWISLFCDYSAAVEIVYVEPPWQQILKQNRSRTDPVPQYVISKLAEKTEPPTWEESHMLHYIC